MAVFIIDATRGERNDFVVTAQGDQLWESTFPDNAARRLAVNSGPDYTPPGGWSTRNDASQG